MGRCRLCNSDTRYISNELEVCLQCIRERPFDALPVSMGAHRRSRVAFRLPVEPPRDPECLPCNICVHECRIPENGIGYCGVRRNREGRLTGVSAEEGKLSWYYDPLPTNCVADWVCPGGTGAGYPKYAYRKGPEIGYKNLAVFFNACTFNCLYCQNWHYRRETLKPHATSVHKLVSDVDEHTSCICYFGGDPTLNSPLQSGHQGLPWRRRKGRSSGYAGRQMALCTRDSSIR